MQINLIEEKIGKYTTMLRHNKEVYDKFEPFDDKTCKERTASLTTIRLCEELLEELNEIKELYKY